MSHEKAQTINVCLTKIDDVMDGEAPGMHKDSRSTLVATAPPQQSTATLGAASRTLQQGATSQWKTLVHDPQ